MPIGTAAPAASTPAPAPNGASGTVKPSGNVVKPNPVIPSKHESHSAGGAPPPPKPEGTAPPPAQPNRLTRKERIDGKEVELSATEDELWAAHRKGTTADRRFEEASRLRREVEAESQRTQAMLARAKDPEQLLSIFMEQNPDADPVEVLSAILQKKMHEEEQLQDPNIRERRRLERENEQYKSQAQKAEETRVRLEQDAATEAARDELAGKFSEALALTKLPKNDITIELMAKAEFTNRKHGWGLTPQQLAAATEKSVHSMIESILTNEDTTDEQLLAAYPALTKRIHRAIVGQYKKRSAGTQQQTDVTPRERRPSSEEPPKQRVVSSQEEHKAYGGKGLRTL